jgi:hypothetical protein
VEERVDNKDVEIKNKKQVTVVMPLFLTFSFRLKKKKGRSEVNSITCLWQ